MIIYWHTDPECDPEWYPECDPECDPESGLVKIKNFQLNRKITNPTENVEILNFIAQKTSDCIESDTMEDDLAVPVKNQEENVETDLVEKFDKKEIPGQKFKDYLTDKGEANF